MRACPQCAMYRLRIIALKAQIERLRQIIDRLTHLIKRIEQEAGDVYNESAPVVQQRSGVKRAVWAYHKGRYQVAVKVLIIIRGG